MGKILLAVCEKCSFDRQFGFGSGREDFGTVCYVPAINIKTGEFKSENYLDKKLLNGEYVFYNEPKMYNGEKELSDHQLGDILLKAKNNFCPQCRNYSLEFKNYAIAD